MTEELAERLAIVVGGMSRRLRPSADSLTHIALSALASVERLGEVRPGDLARVEGMAAPGMTRLLGDLEGRGLVSRSPDPLDGRSHLVRLTGAGIDAVADARRDRAAGVASILEAVDGGDVPTVERAVGVLERALLATTPTPVRAA